MALTDTAKQEALNGIVIDEIKLHSADPTAAGSVGLIAGTQTTVAYSSASAGTRSLSTTYAIPIALAGQVVSHFSLWGAGTLKAYKVFDSAAETYANANGTANVTSADITLSDVV